MQTELELFCPRCSATELCDSGSMLARLRSIGLLKREAKPDRNLVLELFRTSAAKFGCHSCGGMGLAVRTPLPDRWPQARACESCGVRIPAERLEIFPDAVRCAACETRNQTGQQQQPVEYCPRCGEIMTVRLSPAAGISRYAMFCPKCKR